METRREEMRKQVVGFHNKHPEVWDWFVKFTFERIERGYQHYSVNGVFERIRWELGDVGGDGSKTFKIGNNHRAFYARRFHNMYPDFDGFFRTRKQNSEKKPATNLPEMGPHDFDYE